MLRLFKTKTHKVRKCAAIEKQGIFLRSASFLEKYYNDRFSKVKHRLKKDVTRLSKFQKHVSTQRHFHKEV